MSTEHYCCASLLISSFSTPNPSPPPIPWAPHRKRPHLFRGTNMGTYTCHTSTFLFNVPLFREQTSEKAASIPHRVTSARRPRHLPSFSSPVRRITQSHSPNRRLSRQQRRCRHPQLSLVAREARSRCHERLGMTSGWAHPCPCRLRL
jgi:hypothetical protein